MALSNGATFSLCHRGHAKVASVNTIIGHTVNRKMSKNKKKCDKVKMQNFSCKDVMVAVHQYGACIFGAREGGCHDVLGDPRQLMVPSAQPREPSSQRALDMYTV
jgi:hypothetical protein